MNKTSFKDLECNIQTNITNFQTIGLSFLETLSEENLSNMLSYLNQIYYELLEVIHRIVFSSKSSDFRNVIRLIIDSVLCIQLSSI